MITDQKTSLLIPSQFPAFIRDEVDYSKFVAFVQAYYEWLELEGNVTNESKNIPAYVDIDTTTDKFLNYYINEFLPNFPTNSLLSKESAIKVARQLYQSKGTPAAYQFLFKILYNSDFQVFFTKDAVLRASDGVWYISKSLRISSTDPNWFQAKNLRIFGETSKTIAVIENVVATGNKIEVFLSDIQRLFQSGETVRVVDNKNQDVLFDGAPLSAKIVGQVSQIRIDPKNRGLLYEPGDPIVVYGGLNPTTENPVAATATVGETTSGSIVSLNVVNGGWGYRLNPNTIIDIYNGGGAAAYVATINPAAANVANVFFAPTDLIGVKKNLTLGANNYNFSNTAVANANTTLANAFTFTSFTTYPISSLVLTNRGGGITKIPEVHAETIFKNEAGENSYLKTLGILAPIQILDGGSGYKAGETITISGGTGYGAYANIASVNSTGAILSTQYISGPEPYPLGGMGYRPGYMPTLTINSANTHTTNAAVIYVPTVLGDAATFSVIADRTGSITTINIIDYGEDYVAAPNVSLKVQDLAISNVSLSMVPQKGDIVYQGVSLQQPSYKGIVDSSYVLQGNGDPNQIIYGLRVYNYTTQPNPSLPLYANGQPELVATIINQNFAADSFFNGSPQFKSGIKNYGDGSAKATASFLNGLTISEGKYLNTRGQPSAYDVLQSTIFNDFTYQITVEKEISKYRNVLLSLLHPTGTKVIGRYAMKSNTRSKLSVTHAVLSGYPLSHYTGYTGSGVKMEADFTNKSNNIVQFTNLGDGVDIATFIFAGIPGRSNTIIEFTSPHGPNVKSEILSVNNVSNTVTLKESTWLTFGNVATVQANSGTHIIKVNSLTGAYDIINNGDYLNPTNKLKDIVFVGDRVKIANNNADIVTSINYTTGEITVANTINNTVTSLLSVNRTITTNKVELFGFAGVQYQPYLATEDGLILTDEAGNILIIG